MRGPRPLDAEQFAALLSVLRCNHDYYMRQGMNRPHMWPDEIASEVQAELRYRQENSGKRNDTDSGGDCQGR